MHGRSAAGGQSQQRFARRREKQAAEALAAAADTAAAVFGRYGRPLDALVLGGDRRAVAGLRDDPRLRGYFGVAVERSSPCQTPGWPCCARPRASSGRSASS